MGRSESCSPRSRSPQRKRRRDGQRSHSSEDRRRSQTSGSRTRSPQLKRRRDYGHSRSSDRHRSRSCDRQRSRSPQRKARKDKKHKKKHKKHKKHKKSKNKKKRHPRSRSSSPDSEPRGTPQLQLLSGSATVQGSRPYQEDRGVFELHPSQTISAAVEGSSGDSIPHGGNLRTARWWFAAVYDGHGGARASEYCAAELHRSLFEKLPDGRSGGGAEDSAAAASDEVVQLMLKESFASTEHKFMDIAQRENYGDGTTATVILIEPATCRLFAAQLGDSRAVLGRAIGPDWEAVPLTVDHKPQDPQEKRRVESVGGEVVFLGCWRVSHPDSTSYLACSRAIGDLALKVPHAVVSAVPDVTMRTLDRTMDCLVIVASDGVWDVITDSEAVEIASRAMAEVHGESEAERDQEPDLPSWAMPGPKPTGGQNAVETRRAALAIVREALERGSADNITALVYALDWKRRSATT